MHIAQPALIGVHACEEVGGIAWKGRRSNLCRIAEFLEGDAGGVDAGRISLLDLRHSFHRPQKKTVDYREGEVGLIRLLAQPGADLAEPPAHARDASGLEALAGDDEKALLAPLKAGSEILRPWHGLGHPGKPKLHHLDIAQVIESIEDAFDAAPQLAHRRALLDRADDLQCSQKAAGADAQIVDRNLRQVVPAIYEQEAVLSPAASQCSLEGISG